MAGPVPVAGYPSKIEAILAMRAQGLSNAAVAAALGTTAPSVRAAQRSRKNWPNSRAIRVTPDVLDDLAGHASARNLTANALARALLCAVIEDGLIEAILDDGVRP